MLCTLQDSDARGAGAQAPVAGRHAANAPAKVGASGGRHTAVTGDMGKGRYAVVTNTVSAGVERHAVVSDTMYAGAERYAVGIDAVAARTKSRATETHARGARVLHPPTSSRRVADAPSSAPGSVGAGGRPADRGVRPGSGSRRAVPVLVSPRQRSAEVVQAVPAPGSRGEGLGLPHKPDQPFWGGASPRGVGAPDPIPRAPAHAAAAASGGRSSERAAAGAPGSQVGSGFGYPPPHADAVPLRSLPPGRTLPYHAPLLHPHPAPAGPAQGLHKPPCGQPPRTRRPLSAVMAELPWVAPPQAPQGLPSAAETALDRSWGPLESPDDQTPALAHDWDGAAEAGPISSQSPDAVRADLSCAQRARITFQNITRAEQEQHLPVQCKSLVSEQSLQHVSGLVVEVLRASLWSCW